MFHGQKSSNDLTFKDFQRIDKKLSLVSPTFCLAKFYQVTLNLHSGLSASCCLQTPKKIDHEKVEKNPYELHNGKEHIEERYELLGGKEVEACQSCWKSEKEGSFSERHFKSGDYWARTMVGKIPRNFEKIRPTYVEVGFSRKCQMRCCYCHSGNSSAIAKEIDENGPYPTSKASPKEDIRDTYTSVFWKWLPAIYRGLKVLRVTGGEPFLSEDTFYFLDYMKKHKAPRMNLEFNTNLSFPLSILNRFIESFKGIPRQHYREVRFFVSLDCWGRESEYIRFGMKTSIIESNIKKLLNHFPFAGITITATVNALAVPSFYDLIVKVKEWKKTYGRKKIQLSSYPLVFPDFQCVELLGKRGLAIMKKTESFVIASPWFSPRERQLVGNIRKRCGGFLPMNQKEALLRDFYRFFHEYDKRKKTDFLKTFPSFCQIYKKGRHLSERQKRQWQKDLTTQSPPKALAIYRKFMGLHKANKSVLVFLSRSLVDSKTVKDVFCDLLHRDPQGALLKNILQKTVLSMEEKDWRFFLCLAGIGPKSSNTQRILV